MLKAEGYIRDYSTTEFGNGRTEFAIELKYYDGQPVIRVDRARLEAGPARLCVGRRDAARGGRPRHHHPVDARTASWRTMRRASSNVGGEVLCKVF